MPEDTIEKLFNIIDRKRGTYIEVLKEAVSIRSIRGDQSESRKALSWISNKLKELGAATTLHSVGSIVSDNSKIELPPVLIADLKSEEFSKVTLLVYGHLDVKPDSQSSNRDPFDLVEENGFLFGNGVTDSKGPLLCWINAIQAYNDLGSGIPINIRFFIEVMNESGSMGLMTFLNENKGLVFKNINYICISDSSCLFSSKPLLTYGLRGCCKFLVTVEGGKTDLHSGVHGGMVAEPMTDMVYLMSNLVDNKGKILIPNIHDNIDEVTPEEEKAYHRLSFDISTFKNTIGVDKLLHKDDKKRLLMHRTRFPSLSIHGIHTGLSTAEDAIPCKVSASFTIRIVPKQIPEDIFRKVQVYLMYLFNKVQSPNKMTIEMPVAVPPWLGNPDGPNFKCAIKAVQRVYKQEPDLIREGSSIPIVRELQDISGKSVLLLPVGCNDHTIKKNQNKIEVKTFMDGTKVVTAYIRELSFHKQTK